MPGIELMERAGRGLAALVAERAPEGRVIVVCGKGNNGGDGLVCARVLREQGREVGVLTLADPDEYQGDARTNLERLPGDKPQGFTPQPLTEAAAVVDAMLGTGFAGTPREPVASAIDAINDRSERAAVIACDVPSGVNGSTGEIAGAAVRANATATFHAAKPGLWIAPGKAHAGWCTGSISGSHRVAPRRLPWDSSVAACWTRSPAEAATPQNSARGRSSCAEARRGLPEHLAWHPRRRCARGPGT